ncbi:MAG: hypothetical protein ACE5DR_01860 [Thermodesulfobacteriota bacterium]
MQRLLTGLIVLVSFILIGANANAFVEVEARYWFTNLNSNIEATSGAVLGTDLDLVSDLGLDDHENFLEGRVTLELGSHRLRYAYTPLSWSGEAIANKSFNFAGQTFPVSSSVSTDLKVDYHRFSYGYDFIDTLDNRLGVIVEVKYLDGRVNLKDAAFGLDESTRLQIPIPAVGIGGQLAIPFLANLRGEITGMSLGSTAYVVDGEANVGFHPLPFVNVSAGYRYLKFHVEKDDDIGSVSLRGPFITLSASF